MRRVIELVHKQSCINRADDNEMVFVLLGRDAAAPVAIMRWVEERLRLGKNKITDDQISEAVKCADFMENERTGLWERPKITLL